MKKLLLNTSKIVFFLGIGAFFIWLFMHNLSPDEKKEIYHSFLNANYYWLLISILIMLISHVSRTIRWVILLEPLGYQARKKNVFLALMIGYFANLALPRMGEITRCGVLTKYEKIPLQKTFGTVVTERIIDMISLILALLINFFIHLDKLKHFKKTTIYSNFINWYDQIENPNYIYYSLGAIFVLFFFIAFKLRHRISHNIVYKKIKEVFFGFLEGLKSLIQIKKPMWFIFHSFIIWIMYLLMVWVVFFALEQTTHLGLDVALSVLVFGSIGVIIVQGGIGIYPWIVAEILAIFSILSTTGYAMGWLIWTGQTIMIVVGGILSLLLLPIINSKKL